MFQNKPTLEPELEKGFRSLAESEGEKVATICRLVHNESGLLSAAQICSDWNVLLDLARTIVSSHLSPVSESDTARPFDKKMYDALVQNEGPRVADICRQIFDGCDLARSPDTIDWDLLVDQARWIISPYSGIESEAQANMEIGFPGIRFLEDEY